MHSFLGWGEESLYDVRGWLSGTFLAIHCLNGSKSTYEKLLIQCKSHSTVFITDVPRMCRKLVEK